MMERLSNGKQNFSEESYLAALFEEMPLGICLVDADFQIKAINQAAHRIFGDISDLVGREFSEAVHILWNRSHADKIIDLFRQTLETGEPYYAPERIERQNEHSVELYEWQFSRFESADGNRGVICYFRDVSALISAPQTAIEAAKRYRTLIDSIDEGFCVVEMLFDEHEKPVDYRFLEINRVFEQQTGIENGVGKRMRKIAPLHEEHWFELYGKVALTGEAIRFENQPNSSIDGMTFTLFASASLNRVRSVSFLRILSSAKSRKSL